MMLRLTSAKALLYVRVFVVDLLYVSVGCVLTWPSPLVGRLGLTYEEASWIGSLMALGAAFGPGLTSWAQSRLGRKPALMAAGGAFLASWAILASSQEFPVLCVGRLLGGVGTGVAFIGIPVYLTEISDVEERQAVTTFTEFFLGIGYLIVYLGGPNLDYEPVQGICAAVTLCFLAGVTMLPESPVFLVSKGQKDVALKVLTDLRKSETTAQLELEEIEKYLEEEAKESGTGASIFSSLSEPGHTRALLLSLFALTLQQMSGIIVMICYLEFILDSISLPLDKATAAVIIGCGNLPSILISPPMARYLGTKLTLVICSVAMAVSLITFTIYEDFEIKGYDVKKANFIPILTLFFYNVFFCAGLGPLTWSVVAEISPPKIKSFVCFISSTFCWIAAFILLLVFHPAWLDAGPISVFGFFSACLVIGTILVQVTLPDTKGLSLQEIQDIMTGKQITKNTSTSEKDKQKSHITKF